MCLFTGSKKHQIKTHNPEVFIEAICLRAFSSPISVLFQLNDIFFSASIKEVIFQGYKVWCIQTIFTKSKLEKVQLYTLTDVTEWLKSDNAENYKDGKCVAIHQ